MKKLIAILFLAPLLVMGGDQDFVKGVDMTGRTNITQVALNLLVDNAVVATNKGLVIVTNNTPSVANNPKLVRYVWMDTSVNPPVLKVYNTNSGAWVTATIAAGSITTAMLADSAVSTIKIANSAVDNSKLADDSVTSAKIVDGTVGSADLGANSVIRGKIFNGAVDGNAITNGAIGNNHLQGGVIQYSNLASGIVLSNGNIPTIYGSNIGLGTITGSNIDTNTIQGTNIAAGAISTNNLATNIVTLLPRVFATLDASGNILRGLGFSSAVRTSAGDFTLTFQTSPGFTNYCVLTTSGDFSGSSLDYAISVTTNTTDAVSVNCWRRSDGADVDPDLVYIMVMY